MTITSAEKRIFRMCVWLAVCAIVATLGGLFLPELYRDDAYINAQWYGQDFATLVMAVPALLVSAYFGLRRAIVDARIVLAGVLGYFVYTYAFFGFVAAFNRFYLLHVVIFSLATFSLIFLFNILRPGQIAVRAKRMWPVRLSAVYVLLLAAMLTALWMREIFNHLFVEGYRSDMPSGEAPTIVFTLDLGFVVPLALFAAVAAWRRRFWGFLLLGFVLILSTLIGFGLMAMSANLYLLDFALTPELSILWLVLGVMGLVLSGLYLRALECWRIEDLPPRVVGPDEKMPVNTEGAN